MTKPALITVVYVGPAEAVEAPAPGGFIHFPHGEPVEVPADLAERLLQQNIFTTPKSKKEAD